MRKQPQPYDSPLTAAFLAPENNPPEEFKKYKKRWLMLYLLVMCSVCTSMQYVQYTIIADVMVEFYGISYEAVDWSIMILMLFYIPFNFLGLYIIEKIGSQKSIIIAMLGACAATWIKVGSVSPDRYWVVLLAQGVLSISQVFLTPLPARFASAWFCKDQVALSCSIGVSGIQLGVALGFILPPLVVKPSHDKDIIAYNMYIMNLGFSTLSTLFLVLSIFFFQSDPPTPPSRSQQQLEELNKSSFKESTKNLFTNSSYNILLITYSINGGVYNTIPALLNQIILHYYPDGSELAGKIGLVMLLTGLFGATAFGYILDRFQHFKKTSIMAYALYLMAMVLFSLSLTHSIIMVYLAAIILGFFMSAANSIGLQLAAEFTYPEPESTSSGYLLVSGELMGMIFIYLYSFIFYKFGAIWSNVLTCSQLVISTILIICIPFDLRRKAAESIGTVQ